MAGGKVYRELQGEELVKKLQDVTEEDFAYLEDLRKNGGADTKARLEKFGKEKLGIDLHKNFRTDRLLDEGLLPELKKRLGIQENAPAPITSVVTPESMDDLSASIAEDIPAAKAKQVISDMATGDAPVAAPGHQETLKRRPVKVVPEFLKNIDTGNVFMGTKALAGMSHMYACNKDGKLMSEM